MFIEAMKTDQSEVVLMIVCESESIEMSNGKIKIEGFRGHTTRIDFDSIRI